MSLVKVSAEVSKECRKQLKILALEKDTTLALMIADILDRAVIKRAQKSNTMVALENTA
jgi:formate dehydrogenase maturation protein FdhE